MEKVGGLNPRLLVTKFSENCPSDPTSGDRLWAWPFCVHSSTLLFMINRNKATKAGRIFGDCPTPHFMAVKLETQEKSMTVQDYTVC